MSAYSRCVRDALGKTIQYITLIIQSQSRLFEQYRFIILAVIYYALNNAEVSCNADSDCVQANSLGQSLEHLYDLQQLPHLSHCAQPHQSSAAAATNASVQAEAGFQGQLESAALRQSTGSADNSRRLVTSSVTKSNGNLSHDLAESWLVDEKNHYSDCR